MKSEMWVRHLRDVRKHRQEGAHKASAKRKEKSKGSKSSKAVVDCTDSWCICGGPEWGDVIAGERKDCPIEWFHFQCVGLQFNSARWRVDLCTMQQQQQQVFYLHSQLNGIAQEGEKGN